MHHRQNGRVAKQNTLKRSIHRAKPRRLNESHHRSSTNPINTIHHRKFSTTTQNQTTLAFKIANPTTQSSNSTTTLQPSWTSSPLRSPIYLSSRTFSKYHAPGKLSDIMRSTDGFEQTPDVKVDLNSLLSTPKQRQQFATGTQQVPAASRKQSQFQRERNAAVADDAQKPSYSVKPGSIADKLASLGDKSQKQQHSQITLNRIRQAEKLIEDFEMEALPQKQGAKAIRDAKRQAKRASQGKSAKAMPTNNNHLPADVARAVARSRRANKYQSAHDRAISVSESLKIKGQDFTATLSGRYPTTLEDARAISPHACGIQQNKQIWLADMSNDPFMLNYSFNTQTLVAASDREDPEISTQHTKHNDTNTASGADATAQHSPSKHHKQTSNAAASLVDQHAAAVASKMGLDSMENEDENLNSLIQVAQSIHGDSLEELAYFKTDVDNLITKRKIDLIPEEEGTRFENLMAKELLREQVIAEYRSKGLLAEDGKTILQEFPQHGDDHSESDIISDEFVQPTRRSHHSDNELANNNSGDDNSAEETADEAALEQALNQLLAKSNAIGVDSSTNISFRENRTAQVPSNSSHLDDTNSTKQATPLSVDDVVEERFAIAYASFQKRQHRHKQKQEDLAEAFERELYQARIHHKLEQGLGYISELEEPDSHSNGRQGGDDDDEDDVHLKYFDEETGYRDSNNIYLPRRYMKLYKKGKYQQRSARRHSPEELEEFISHRSEWSKDTDNFYSKKELLKMHGYEFDEDPEEEIASKRLERYKQKTDTWDHTTANRQRHRGVNIPSKEDVLQQEDVLRSLQKRSSDSASDIERVLGSDEEDVQQLLHSGDDENDGIVYRKDKFGSLSHNDNGFDDNSDDYDVLSDYDEHNDGVLQGPTRGKAVIDINEFRDDGEQNPHARQRFVDSDEEAYVHGHVTPNKSVGKLVGGDAMETFEMHEDDLEERFVRGSGPGGQSVNKTKNCVWLQHVPTGTIVKCAQTRELHRNRAIARRIMYRKLEALTNGKESYLGRKIDRLQKRKERSRRRQGAINPDKLDDKILKLKKKLGLTPSSPTIIPSTDGLADDAVAFAKNGGQGENNQKM